MYAGDEDQGWCEGEDYAYDLEYGADDYGMEDYEPSPYDGTYSEC